MKMLGFRGIEVGTNVRRLELADTVSRPHQAAAVLLHEEDFVAGV